MECGCGCGGETSRRGRFLRGHNLRVANPMSGQTSWNKGRFSRTGVTSSDVQEEDRGYLTPCLIWKRSCFPNGYGKVRIWRDGIRRTLGTHRVAWEQAHGPIPQGLVLDHLCEQPSCCNPEHMRVVPQRHNVRRGAATKLTWDDVTAIRDDSRSESIIAATFGISKSQVGRIRRGERWVLP